MNECLTVLKSVFFEGKALYCSTFLSAIAFTYFFYKRYSRSSKSVVLHNAQANTIPDHLIINEVLFFSEKYASCMQHNEFNKTCDSDDCGFKKLKKLIAYIDSATTSLDVCVYTITSYKLAHAILYKFKQGVRVRIITDEGMAIGDGSQIPLFRQKNVLVRARQSAQYLMHHKFAIVDRRLLINGSFNWTSQATFGNWENVYICNYPRSLVQQYCNEFDNLWNTLV